jgi:hypothetical protein
MSEKKSVMHHEALMEKAYKKHKTFMDGGGSWQERFTDPKLTNKERVAVILGNFNYQVCNGGIDQYVGNGFGMEQGLVYGCRAYQALGAIMAASWELDPAVAAAVMDLARAVPAIHSETLAPGETMPSGTLADAAFQALGKSCAELDDAYFEFDEERVFAFFQKIIDGWDDGKNPFKTAESFSFPPPGGVPHVAIRHPGIEIDLEGLDGNAFVIMGRVTGEMRRHRVADEDIEAFQAEARRGDYDQLLRTVMRWVSVKEPGRGFRH